MAQASNELRKESFRKLLGAGRQDETNGLCLLTAQLSCCPVGGVAHFACSFDHLFAGGPATSS